MDIWSLDKLPLFVTLFVPGFVSIQVYRLLVPSERRDWSSSLFEAIGYGVLNFFVWAWLVIILQSGSFYAEHTTLYFLLWFVVIVIAPAIWPVLFLKLATWGPISRFVLSPYPTAWDHVFGLREPFWILVNLRDGSRVGGKFGVKSFASAFPAEEQIYLEEVWTLDRKGAFSKRVEGSRGIIVLGKDISSLELFESGGEIDAGEEEAQG